MARQEGARRRRSRGDSDDDFEVEMEKSGPATGGMRMQSSPHIGVTKVSNHYRLGFSSSSLFGEMFWCFDHEIGSRVFPCARVVSACPVW